MSKLLVLYAASAAPLQVDDFGPDAERSVTGSLYLFPGSARTMTRGELAHLQSKYPEVAAKLTVLREDPLPPTTSAKPEPKPEKAVAETEEEPTEKRRSSSRSRKRKSTEE